MKVTEPKCYMLVSKLQVNFIKINNGKDDWIVCNLFELFSVYKCTKGIVQSFTYPHVITNLYEYVLLHTE